MDNDRYPYWPLPERPPISWPDGARVAFWVILNVEYFRFDRPLASSAPGGPSPDVFNFSLRDYGARVGIWRIMDALDKNSLRATAALNAEVCNHAPQIVRAGSERNWEWMGHGITNSVRLSGLDPEQERQTIQAAVRTVAEATGRPPKGWLGPGLAETHNTPDLLADAGISYVSDWWADDQPFPLRVKRGRLLSLPMSHPTSDIPAYVDRGFTPEQFYQNVCEHLDVLHEEGERGGRLFGLSLHPFLSGHPVQARWLSRALEYVAGHEGVWLATGGEISDWYYDHYYEQAPI